ncbi:Cytochrome P450 [Allosphingosinicella indica]|uniref:Cytochrome P450 n=2 Tax=Allosphingosinicella indica TaxID=941907 RepID=A0A1X7FZW9_9SPHN|nr:Cytochrome P450 [Allosphingosinicella indica]
MAKSMPPLIPRANGEGILSSLKMTRAYLRDPPGVMQRLYERHGPVVEIGLFGMRAIVLLGPDANELVLLNRDGAFSSELGWDPVIGSTFPRGLISIDDGHHRDHRRLIGAAFKAEPMQAYLDGMRAGIGRDLENWPLALAFYPEIKRLTLDLAAQCLLGLPLGTRATQVGRDFITMLGASTALIRRPIIGGGLWRGMRARRRLHRTLLAEIPQRRRSPGPDIFSAICIAVDEHGAHLGEEAIVDHMSLLLMAAHDTTSSALTSVAFLLGRHPEWQERVRAELRVWTRDNRGRVTLASLRQLELCEMVISEALRLMPPVPSLPRGLTRDVEFAGHRLPKGASVGIHILHTHRMEELWPDPERFDPMRFTAEEVRRRHRYAWLPFGGGAHMCLGLHFATVQMKLFLAELLGHRRIVLRENYSPEMLWLPIAHPKDGLNLLLEKI